MGRKLLSFCTLMLKFVDRRYANSKCTSENGQDGHKLVRDPPGWSKDWEINTAHILGPCLENNSYIGSQ